jgi:hypothetical protein
MGAEETLEAAAAAYGKAEQEFISALAAGADDRALHDLVSGVVKAADDWETADREAPLSSQGVTRYYDLPEVVATLWRDLAEAYQRRCLGPGA